MYSVAGKLGGSLGHPDFLASLTIQWVGPGIYKSGESTQRSACRSGFTRLGNVCAIFTLSL